MIIFIYTAVTPYKYLMDSNIPWLMDSVLHSYSLLIGLGHVVVVKTYVHEEDDQSGI